MDDQVKATEPVNFDTSNSGTWFYYDEEHPDSGGVCIRLLSAEQSRKISKIITKTKQVMQGGQLVLEKKVDEKLELELMYDYCIVDWNNTSLDGELTSCTIGNKVRAMRCIDFAKFVANAMEMLASQNKTLEETRLKNSGNTLNGHAQSQTV